jgi:hypothetical protein
MHARRYEIIAKHCIFQHLSLNSLNNIVLFNTWAWHHWNNMCFSTFVLELIWTQFVSSPFLCVGATVHALMYMSKPMVVIIAVMYMVYRTYVCYNLCAGPMGLLWQRRARTFDITTIYTRKVRALSYPRAPFGDKCIE